MKVQLVRLFSAIAVSGLLVACNDSVTNNTTEASSSSQSSSSAGSAVCRFETPNQTQCDDAMASCQGAADAMMQFICNTWQTACASPNPASCPKYEGLNGGSSAVLSSSSVGAVKASSSSSVAMSSAVEASCTTKATVMSDACVEVCHGSLGNPDLGAALDAERLGTSNYKCTCDKGTREGPGGGFWPSFNLPLCSPF